MQIKEIILLTNSLGKAKQFYHQVLGLEINEESDDSIIFVAGASVIHFILDTNTQPIYHFAFSIPHNQLGQGLEWLKTRAELIHLSNGETMVDFPNWKARSIYFYDLNGNILELIARFSLHNASTQPFDGQSLLDISEIAIATDDVKMITQKMNNVYSIPFFARQPQQPNFAAMGDDDGLLIFSSTHRNWYPTQIPAVSFPVKVKIILQEKLKEINFN